MTVSRSRTVAVLVIVVAFIALAALALLARGYRPGRDGVPVPGTALGIATARVAQPASSASNPASPTLVAGVSFEAPGGAPAPASAAAAPTAPPSSPDQGTVALAPCELGLAVPTEQAGLADLVSLVPLFGPFSPEAFAFMPAFEPAFPLAGPMIIAGGEQLAAHQAELDAIVAASRPVELAAFEALLPFYGPYRAQFLAAEGDLASTIAPGVAALAAAPGATCVPAALAQLF